MSLSARDQQALQGIEDDLAGTDPGLAALLATFTRLTSDEEMPAREKVTAVRRDSRHALSRRPVLRWVAPLLSALIAIAVVAGVTAIKPGRDACVTSWPAACQGTAPAHSSRPASDAVVREAPSAARKVPVAAGLVP